MSSKFYLGLGCVSREVIFGLREVMTSPPYVVLGFVLKLIRASVQYR